MNVRPGVRLRSATCDTEIVVIRGKGEIDLRCGGVPMLPVDSGPATERHPIDPAFADGTVIGKRHSDDEAGLEVLCVKPGAGSLSIGAHALPVLGARPLPASD